MPQLNKIPEKYKDKKIYSYSKLGSYHNCQYGYYLNYILKKENKQNIYGYLGSEVHEILEKLQPSLITNEEALRMFDNSIIQSQLKGYKFPTPKSEKSYIKAVKDYLRNYNPINCKNFVAEKELFLQLDNDIVVRMFIDLIVLNQDMTVSVYDYKTSNKFAKNELLDKGRQLVIYGLGIEQNFPKYKVKDLYWDMLKYTNVVYGKTSRMIERHSIGEKLENNIRKRLDKNGIDDFEVEMYIDNIIDGNNLSCLPKDIKDIYTFDKSFVEHPYTEEYKNEAIQYIRNTVKEIENKNKNNEDEWKPKEITQYNNFFCSNLCGCKQYCKYYQEFISGNKNNFSKKEKEQEMFNENLFD